MGGMAVLGEGGGIVGRYLFKIVVYRILFL